jgi:PHD/YefM family antitoxin component YafN of YafNO toxin-antitoxin module
MKRVSTLELLRNFGVHGDTALTEPVILTKNGRDRLMLISIERYEMLQRAYDASLRARDEKSPADRS